MASCSSCATVCLLAFVAVAAVADLRTRRIPNVLTVAAALVGLVLNLWRSGAHGALASGAGALAGLAAFLPFYLAGGFGAGDVKGMGAVGAFVGVKGVVLAAIATLLVGGLGALMVLALLRFRNADAQNGRGYASTAQYRFPYGLAIACGTMLSLLWTLNA